MTTYGGISILRCSVCTGHINHHLLASGNNFGARYWTDGWKDMPMLPEQPSLVKCPHCRAMVWISNLEEVASLDRFAESSPEFPDATDYIKPSHADYLQYASENPALTDDDQRYVRIRAWWRGNDARRGAAEPAALSESERDNMVRLAGLLREDDDNDRLVRAEIMRQLGEFAAAKAILRGEFAKEVQWAAEFIGRLTEKQVSSVAEMH